MPRRIRGVPSGCLGRVTEVDLKLAKTGVRAIYRDETAIAPALVKPLRAGYNAARSRIDRGSVSLDHPTLLSLKRYYRP
jgi:hypothetical protein